MERTLSLGCDERGLAMGQGEHWRLSPAGYGAWALTASLSVFPSLTWWPCHSLPVPPPLSLCGQDKDGTVNVNALCNL